MRFLGIRSVIYSLLLFSLEANAQSQLDSLKQAVAEMSDDSIKVASLLTIAELIQKGEEARSYSEQGLDLAKALDLKHLMVSAYVTKSQICEPHELDKKISYLDSAIHISRATDDQKGFARIRIAKSFILRSYGFFDEAIKELQLSYDYGVKSKSEDWQMTVVSHLCGCYIGMEKPKEAQPYCQKYVAYYSGNPDIENYHLYRNRRLAPAYYCLAKVSEDLGNIALSCDYYIESYHYAKQDSLQNNLQDYLVSLVNLASKTLVKSKDTSIVSEKIQAIGFSHIEAILDTAAAFIDTMQDYRKLYNITDSRRQWEVAKGNYQKAYAYLAQLKELNETSKFSENNLAAVADFRVKSERDKLQIQLLEEEIQTQIIANEVNLLLLLLGISLLLLAISVLVYQNRQKSNRLLLSAAKQEQQITSIRSMLEGQDRERTRIARDLHDGLGNMLSTVKASMERLQYLVSGQQAEKAYSRASEMIDEACTEVRKIAYEMMPHALEKLGLRKALEDLVFEMDRNHDFEVSLNVFGPEQVLDDSTNIMLYRIVQEAFNNIIKYAAAKEVIVQMTYGEHWLNLTIEDDGKGFDVNELTDNKGMGLKSIAFRTQYIGGEYEINSHPDQGTSVSINLPLKVVSN